MKDYYAALGITKEASADDVKKAYRKLASKHHPDKGGDKAKFQEIQEAYDILSNPEKRMLHDHPQQQQFHEQFHNMDEVIRKMREAHQHMRANLPPEFVTEVPMRDAYNGFNMGVEINGKQETIKIVAGLPNNARLRAKTNSGLDVFVTVRQIQGEYRTPPLDEVRPIVDSTGTRLTGEIGSGHVEYLLHVDALDIMLGAWIDVNDFLGEPIKMRVPAGFDVKQKLKVKGKGYANWNTEKNAAGRRADMFVTIVPVFKPVKELDLTKVQDLLSTVKLVQGVS
jgi:DnaJ-class molecular chaperone